MKVLGIVGSPRRDQGTSHRLVSAVLDGACGSGADVELMQLIDEAPGYCVHCGHACFEDGLCPHEPEAAVRAQQIEAADALVIATPVYVWQVAGLAAAFFDRTRLSTGAWVNSQQHGRHALGIAVAGGTGSGVFTALQSIYAWLCLWKFRPLEPLPVTRFNLDDALARAPIIGRALAETPRRGFADTADLLTTYDGLTFLRTSRADEFRWLGEQTAKGLRLRGDLAIAGAITEQLREGDRRRDAGDALGAARAYTAAYDLGRASW